MTKKVCLISSPKCITQLRWNIKSSLIKVSVQSLITHITLSLSDKATNNKLLFQGKQSFNLIPVSLTWRRKVLLTVNFIYKLNHTSKIRKKKSKVSAVRCFWELELWILSKVEETRLKERARMAEITMARKWLECLKPRLMSLNHLTISELTRTSTLSKMQTEKMILKLLLNINLLLMLVVLEKLLRLKLSMADLVPVSSLI